MDIERKSTKNSYKTRERKALGRVHLAGVLTGWAAEVGVKNCQQDFDFGNRVDTKVKSKFLPKNSVGLKLNS